MHTIFDWFEHVSHELRQIKEQNKTLMADLTQLSTDFANFQGDFSTFVTNVQAALAKLGQTGLTPEQQAIVDSVDVGVGQMDAAIKSIVFPSV